MATLNPGVAEDLTGDFVAFANGHQLPPELANSGEDWTTWLLLGGRGAGTCCIKQKARHIIGNRRGIIYVTRVGKNAGRSD